jgi:uncharacterized protein involved in exopolysaccharide biosynthesis
MEWDEHMTEYVASLQARIEELEASIVVLASRQARTTAALAELVRLMTAGQTQKSEQEA